MKRAVRKEAKARIREKEGEAKEVDGVVDRIGAVVGATAVAMEEEVAVGIQTMASEMTPGSKIGEMTAAVVAAATVTGVGVDKLRALALAIAFIIQTGTLI